MATRQWLERTFRDHDLPPPKVRIETNQILYLPTLFQENELLSFISRRHLAPGGKLREVKLRQTTWRRDFALNTRRNSYLSPAADRMVRTLRARAEVTAIIYQNDVPSTGGANQGLNTQVALPCIQISALCVGGVGENGAITFTVMPRSGWTVRVHGRTSYSTGALSWSATMTRTGTRAGPDQ